MPTPDLDNSPYINWRFSDEESLTSKIFSFNQLAYLQSLKAATAEQILALRYDPNNPLEFVQQDASLRAQLDTYSNLIQDSITAAKILQSSKG